ncbi:N-acetylmuramoyl-L-alanine amidase [Streptomyces carminius]|uniref:N-acetylmuramoyl-L-alanine amidase n=1 Tax=Streptomyces carminius TaxID=2665496 RepID=A0A2M8LUJ2_9ACTN|nr:peptidoglycan recognition protein [Streptomyces carminius]PJE95625.1 N-acetylmuramoyl-L-alanine amidase [Streptomyces carminius]
MRAFIASSIAVACAAAAVLPLSAAAADSGSTAPASAAVHETTSRLPGSTQTLPLVPLESSGGDTGAGQSGDPVPLGLPARDIEPFALLGAVWDDPDEEPRGRIQVRTRAAGTGDWSPWRELESHADRPDPGSAEGGDTAPRGATAPLWVGDSDGVQARFLPGPGPDGDPGGGPEGGPGDDPGAGPDGGQPLPGGLRLDLVHPGDDPPPGGDSSGALTPQDRASSAANAGLAPLGALEIPAQEEETPGGEQLRGGTPAERGTGGRDRGPGVVRAEKPYARAQAPIGPRPGIVTRRGWGADERLRGSFLYTSTVKAAFVHHTAMSNSYTCGQSGSVIRAIYRYHVLSNGWRDVGYNFFVDKCGKIFEGRAGGVARPVKGAHTLGLNDNTTGIAVLGSYGAARPTRAAVEGVAKLLGWKLGLHGVNPRGTAVLTSAGGKYPKGTKVRFRTVSGHRDGSYTTCPGDRLYRELPGIRTLAARLQGR